MAAFITTTIARYVVMGDAILSADGDPAFVVDTISRDGDIMDFRNAAGEFLWIHGDEEVTVQEDGTLTY
jgi:hypothetical protein